MTKLQINSIKLTNFQSHKDTFIEFSEGLNCIIGTSDVGKSALVRALKWVLFNKTPKDFITWGETKCSILITLSNEYAIERIRDNKQNTYKLYFKGIEIETFENFGLEVPLKIKAVVGSLDLVLDTDKIINLNIRSQHDSLFLLSNEYSGTLKAKALNSLAGVHYIDAAIRDIVADTKQDKVSIEKGQIELDKLKVELDTFNDLPSMEVKLQEIIKLNDHILDVGKKVEKVDNLLTIVKGFTDRQQAFQIKKAKYSKVSAEDIKQFESLTNKYTKLYSLCNVIKDFDSRYKVWESKNKLCSDVTKANILQYTIVLDKFKRLNELKTIIDLASFRAAKWKETNKVLLRYDLTKVSKFVELVDKYRGCSSLYGMLGEFNNKVAVWNAHMAHYAIHTKEAKQPYLKAVEHLGTCPICYSKLDAEKLKAIEERL